MNVEVAGERKEDQMQLFHLCVPPRTLRSENSVPHSVVSVNSVVNPAAQLRLRHPVLHRLFQRFFDGAEG